MKIAVCIKQIPNRDYAMSLTDDATWIREEDLAWEINDFDLYSIEAALQLKEKQGADVIVIGVGQPRTSDALRKALAMGADRAILVSDDRIPKTSPYAIATVLASVIRAQEADLVLTGVQSEDMAYFQTGAILAGLLDMESAAMVVAIEPEGDQTYKLQLELEGGVLEEVHVDLPAVFLVQTGWNQPRYATLRGIMMAKKKPLEHKTLDDLGLQLEDLHAKGSRVTWSRLNVPSQETSVEFLDGAPDVVADQLVMKLKKEAKVLI